MSPLRDIKSFVWVHSLTVINSIGNCFQTLKTFKALRITHKISMSTSADRKVRSQTCIPQSLLLKTASPHKHNSKRDASFQQLKCKNESVSSLSKEIGVQGEFWSFARRKATDWRPGSWRSTFWIAFWTMPTAAWSSWLMTTLKPLRYLYWLQLLLSWQPSLSNQWLPQ